MSQPKDFLGGFAQGRMRYLDLIPNQIEDQNRIVLPLHFEDDIKTYAVVDTAAHYCILDPQTAELLELIGDYKPRSEGMNIRGITFAGWRCRVPISLIADEGQNLTVEASVFVPELDPTQQWMLPNFLGLSGFLDRIRFAVDPQENWFYFGAFEG